MNLQEEKKLGQRASSLGFIANIFLAASKLIVGLLAHSQALISDSINSIGDVLSTFVVFIGIKLSRKDADKDHQFGHERLDSVAAIILAMFFLATAGLIAYEGVTTIIEGVSGSIPVPGTLAWVVALIAIVIKEALYWYTMIVAQKIKSTALKAAAWDHQADVVSAAGAFVGILGARLFNFPLLDPILSLLICVLIVITAIRIFKEGVDKLVDKSCDEETEKALSESISKTPGVIRIDILRTRMFGNRVYVDLEISVDGELSLEKAHEISETVHDQIEKEFPLVKHIMIHVNPYSEK